MAATSRMSHLFLYESGELTTIQDRPGWVDDSVKVFDANFTCDADKHDLVDVVLGLYAYNILCAGKLRSKGKDGEGSQNVLSKLIETHRSSIFPAEHFSDTVEQLEAELDVLVADRDASIMTQDEYAALLHARQQLSSIHGDTLDEAAQRKVSILLEKRNSMKSVRNSARDVVSTTASEPTPSTMAAVPLAASNV